MISAADDAEKMDGLFSIELNTRIYVLRAASDEDAAQWVAVLNKIKAEGGSGSGSGSGSGRAQSRTNSPPPSPSPSQAAPSSQAAAGSGGLQSFHIAAEGAGAEDKVRSPSDGNTDWLKSPRRRWQFCGCCS